MRNDASRGRSSAPALLAVAAMSAALLAGCGAGSGAGAVKLDKSNVNDTGLPLVKKPVTLSIFVPSRQPDALYTKDTLVWKELSKRTGIDFKIDTVFQKQSGDKVKMLVASNAMPDIVCGNLADINKYGKMGAFIPLDELITDETPNLKKYLKDDKIIKAQNAGPDGKTYGVPMLTAVKTAMGYCIRQDWLDKLGLKAPTTIDEWHTVLTAFKNKDPNGNGKADEVPLVLDKAWENYYMNFADAWNIEADPSKDYWMVKGGKVVSAAMDPAFKEFLGTMAQWYKEGLIDKEFVTREDTNNYHILNNLAGATCYWTGYVAAQNTNKEVLAKDPKTNWQVIAPPVLKAGAAPRTFSQQDTVGIWGWAISKNNSHVMETLKLFDYVYSDEGSLLFNFGVPGVSYEMKDGQPLYSSAAKGDKDGLMIYMRKNGMQALLGMRQMKEYEAGSCASDDIKRQLFDYVDKGYFFDPTPALKLTDAEKDSYEAKMTPIRTFIEENVIKFMTGIEPMSKWDEYVAQLKKLGIDDLAKYKQQAYQRYMKIVEAK